jgi:hypothetical protein
MKTKPATAAAATPTEPTPPGPPSPPAEVKRGQIDQRTLDTILAADLANIVKKVKAGKPLTGPERDLLAAKLINTAADTNEECPPEIVIGKTTGRPKNGHQGDGGGRPRFKIDFQLVQKLAHIQCTIAEIAACLGCNPETLERSPKFCALYKKGMEGGKMSLRRCQWIAVKGGNTTMMVWLGKQYLKQKDTIETTIQNPDGTAVGPMTIAVVGGVIPKARDAKETKKETGQGA